MKTTPVSFAIGTTVYRIPNEDDVGDTKILGLITDVSVFNGELAYAFGGSAWYEHHEFEWVADPTAESLAKAIEQGSDDEDDEDDEDDYDSFDDEEDDDLTLDVGG